MPLHTLIGAVPPARADGTPWSEARIEESEFSAGPFTQVQTVALAPPDANPLLPQSRNLTFNGILEVGYYRIRWGDTLGNVSPPTAAVYDNINPAPGGGGATGVKPTVTDVANLIRARTKGPGGEEFGTFTAETNPNSSVVLAIIDQVASSLAGCTGDWLPEWLHEKSRYTIALGAAMRIELSYWPEQIDTDRSPYRELKVLFDEEQHELCALADPYRPSDIAGPNDADNLTPVFYYGDGARPSSDVEYDWKTQRWLIRGEGPVQGTWL